MVRVIKSPTMIKAAGSMPKVIEEFFGKVNSHTHEVSIARMVSPQGWEEPGQTPSFCEYTVVLKGSLRVQTKEAVYTVSSGQAVMAEKGTWVKYSTPFEGGAEYVAICLPAFSPDTVHRDEA
ncbi:MAG: hypothetical protein JW795_06665 [Chitinivibrionales bacterium]|nr:hypothetical protein [Chitinivibrionales bacterium]